MRFFCFHEWNVLHRKTNDLLLWWGCEMPLLFLGWCYMQLGWNFMEFWYFNLDPQSGCNWRNFSAIISTYFLHSNLPILGGESFANATRFMVPIFIPSPSCGIGKVKNCLGASQFDLSSFVNAAAQPTKTSLVGEGGGGVFFLVIFPHPMGCYVWAGESPGLHKWVINLWFFFGCTFLGETMVCISRFGPLQLQMSRRQDVGEVGMGGMRIFVTPVLGWRLVSQTMIFLSLD